ncbi:MAG: sigma-70 family RNA polymerase sigma factor [Actinomycetota bacterium]
MHVLGRVLSGGTQEVSGGQADLRSEDRTLMMRVAGGDEYALASLLARYGPGSLGLATRICKNLALAQEVVQEVFLSVWLRAGSFDGNRGSVAAYIFSAVHHRAVDAVRHEVALRRRDEADARLSPVTTGEDVAEAAWLKLRRSEVRAAVARLPALQREALELAYFEGLSYREVAERLAIPQGTAKTRLRDGMIRLRCLVPHLASDPA